ncbi:MAG: type IVB secretion system protein IcmM/DotJ [Legionellaceae bacterium]|nr:type IVB secretion system protein IcmM/DotJ [Legionellaceae bacterium]
MTKVVWRNIKASKRFNVRLYRNIGTMLFISVVLNVCLGMAIYKLYFNQPESTYYATYGEIPPILLKDLDSPNYSSTPLLSQGPKKDDDTREIPR